MYGFSNKLFCTYDELQVNYDIRKQTKNNKSYFWLNIKYFPDKLRQKSNNMNLKKTFNLNNIAEYSARISSQYKWNTL